ncbi:uncharacterized protein STEHIDRAFT_150135 [Stereum hirsutum FP-91666 SS1]|uniref:uncharacterized protein n=1 Tax=Stereum hirsutum (strain FP-91666) TaxID=721885 RepID=UPI000444A7C4|nr:uncharacterized protein STEHIDRAFT_150135 [Stereum hirsutum FP-91666 SS1]EIM81087.1 hypothetical protein STEHIDRAFT_150135 [Stereum hirsutum FP-91666 SS1]
MPSSQTSDHSQTVAGEEAVAAWLDSLPESDTHLIYSTSSTTKDFIAKQFVSEAHGFIGLMITIVRTWMVADSNCSGPPKELVDALHLTDTGRPLREDAVFLFGKHPLPRFLLLACVPESELNRLDALLHAGFQQEYIGGALTRFMTAFELCKADYKPQRHYGRVIPIVQSSGSGKSRLVKELSKTHPLVSVCFRDDAKPTSGWPPGDVPPQEFFALHARTKHYKGEEQAAAFLGALMEVISETIDISKKDILADWDHPAPGEEEQSSRRRLLQLAMARATTVLSTHTSWLESEREWITRLKEMSSRTSTSPKKIDFPLTTSVDWHKILFQKFCTKGFNDLNDKLVALGHDTFFLTLDECAALGETTEPVDIDPLSHITLIAMHRILKAADTLNTKVQFWFLLLDTDPSRYLREPSGPRNSSSRLVRPLLPLPPFVYLGFNQMAHGIKIRTAREALSIKHLQRFGRPYWSTLPPSMVVQSATEKLFCVSKYSPVKFYAGYEDHAFAAFASRAALELCNNEAGTRLAAEDVNHHMRVVTAIVGDKVETKAPSEPALALAAATALTANEEVYNTALNTLLNLILKDLIHNRGDQGELCSRLLFILSRDQAALSVHGKFMDEHKTHVHAVTLAAILETLLGPQYGCPDPMSPLLPKIRTFCRARFVHWTHFHTLTRTLDEIPVDLLEWAWFVGAAIQCAHNQPVIDGFMVHYFGDLDKPYDRERLGIVAWQTKAKEESAAHELGSLLTVPPIVYKDENGIARRVKDETIVILMDFRTEIGESGSGTQLLHRPAATPYDAPNLNKTQKDRIWNGYCDPARGEKEPKNFFVHIRGREREQYPVLRDYSRPLRDLFISSLFGSLPVGLQLLEQKMDRLMNQFEYSGEDD